MDQRTHTWIAVRAIALLEDEGREKTLVSLLKPHARIASVGAWIPDQVDAKRGGAGSDTDNHVLKIEPYRGDPALASRFVEEKDDLLKHIGTYRAAARFLESDNRLDGRWWEAPYKGDVPKPGRHLPNRIMALGTMMKDLLLMGDKRIDHLIPGDIRFAQYMDPALRTREEAAAMYCFMLSHFVADLSMPCHCDGRRLSGYEAGLHKELEGHWSRKVGTGFGKETLTGKQIDSDQLLQQARDTDDKFDLHFDRVPSPIPGFRRDHDAWLEAIYLCRASFAIASIVAPYQTYAYDDPRARAPFEAVLGEGNESTLAAVDQTAMHDAVLNTAIFWKDVWNKVSAE